jgi:cytochrome bd-type quinol oxidase subunit 2
VDAGPYFVALAISVIVAGAWLQARASYTERVTVMASIALLSALVPSVACAALSAMTVDSYRWQTFRGMAAAGLVLFGAAAFAAFVLNRDNWEPGTSFAKRWAISAASAALVGVVAFPFAFMVGLAVLPTTEGP